jgi:hypothetical protein
VIAYILLQQKIEVNRSYKAFGKEVGAPCQRVVFGERITKYVA